MNFISKFCQLLIKSEPFALIIIGLVYWFPSPMRDNWIWVILLLLPALTSRLILYRRLYTYTPLNDIFITFIILCAINIYTAPYLSRGWILLFRPLFGLAIFGYCVEYAKRHNQIKLFIIITHFALFIIGILGFTAITWSSKSAQFDFLISRLPRFTSPLIEGGFNPNELAGVTTWLLPLAVMVLLYWRGRIRLLAAAAFLTAGSALFIGQSFSGLIGTAVGVFFVIVPVKARVATAIMIGIVVTVIQLGILIAPMTVAHIAADVSGRQNTDSLLHRGEMWESARTIIYDYPLTGVGLAMYRQPMIRQRYPTPNFNPAAAVHPHNELLQVGSDVGFPGMVLFIAWYATAGWMIVRILRHGDEQSRILAIGLAGGFIAHIVYGLGDAIPLWDRFAFVGWWMFGLVGGLYLLTQPDSSR